MANRYYDVYTGDEIEREGPGHLAAVWEVFICSDEPMIYLREIDAELSIPIPRFVLGSRLYDVLKQAHDSADPSLQMNYRHYPVCAVLVPERHTRRGPGDTVASFFKRRPAGDGAYYYDELGVKRLQFNMIVRTITKIGDEEPIFQEIRFLDN